MRPQPKVLREARISTNAISYHLLAWGIPIITIPLLPFVWLYYRRYFATLEVVLTARELQVSRGVLVREEKSIPLEKITDLALYQGPIMRWLGLKGLRVETAGQSGSGSALVQLIGLANPDDFRDAALDQRDKVTERLSDAAPDAKADAKADADPVMAEMAATLLRIEELLRRSDTGGAGSGD